MTNRHALLRARLDACPLGNDGWRQFEDVCADVLTNLFVPPLVPPIIQPRTLSGTDRRDLVFPNRITNADSIWGMLRHELDARLVLFEFKNYDAAEITKEEVNQAANYLTHPMGRLAIICSTKKPTPSAHQKRNSVFTQSNKVVLFLTRDHLKEMLQIQERGDDPAVLLMDLLESFYLQHE